MRIVFLADTHLGFDYPIKPRIARRRRGQDFIENFRRVLDHAAQTRPDMVVHGGDLFFRSKVPAKIVDIVYSELFNFAESGIPIFIVPGNHERSRLPQSVWLNHPCIHIFDRPRTFRVQAGAHWIALAGFPFVRENVNRRFTSLLGETGWPGCDAAVRLLCIHQSVEGARVGPSDYMFRKGKDVVQMKDIPVAFSAVLTGHVHRRQILYRSCKRGAIPVLYAGAIERTSFAEKDESKGFFELEFDPDAHGRWCLRSSRFRELPTRPMVELAVDGDLTRSELADFLRLQAANLPEDAIVRLTCQGEIRPALRKKLTASFLRSVFRPTMNVQLGARLRERSES